MPNTKKDTTKRTRDKNIGFWIFGLIGLAILLLLAGRFASESIQESDIDTNEPVDVQSIELQAESSGSDVLESELEAATGAEIPDLDNNS